MNDSTAVILGALTLLLFVIVYVWYALALAAMFSKTGEPTWKAWVPVVNVATVLKLGGFSPWLVLLNLIPLFGTIAYTVVWIIAVHRVSQSFDRGVGMTVLGAFIPVVWASVLGFGEARWEEEAPGVRRSGAVDENSAPIRRGQDFAGPYVPLVGGWTPEPLRPADTDDVAVSSEPVSAPIALPFAAPSPSLSDAVPSPSGWAPPASRADDAPAPAPDSWAAPAPDASASPAPTPPASPAAPAPDGVRDTVDLGDSLADVLAALRAPAPTRDASTAPPVDETPRDAGTPLVPASPHRDRGDSSSDRPVASVAPAEPEAASGEESEPLDLAPWRGLTPRTDADAPAADAPLTRPAPETLAPPLGTGETDDEFPEMSEAVSAVPEAPKAGAPRSARTSVSALYTQPEFPADPAADDFDALDRTVVTRRRRIPWALVPPHGTPVDLTSDVVIVGRRPVPDAAHPDAQLVAIADETRTVSKTHARLQLKGETWYVTDLDSTNGVLFATLMGTEVEAPPGEEIEAGERFFLGDAEVRLARRES